VSWLKGTTPPSLEQRLAAATYTTFTNFEGNGRCSVHDRPPILSGVEESCVTPDTVAVPPGSSHRGFQGISQVFRREDL